MALAVILLIGAGLLIRSYQRISVVDPGFSADHLLTFIVALPEQKYKTSADAGRFMRDARDAPAAITRAWSTQPAYTGCRSTTPSARVPASPAPAKPIPPTAPSAGMRIVTPDYFATMKIPLKTRPAFDARDDERAPEVVAINEEAARRYWPDVNPIGQQLHLGVTLAEARSGMKTIVAIVGDVKGTEPRRERGAGGVPAVRAAPGRLADDRGADGRRSDGVRADGARRSRVARSRPAARRRPHDGRSRSADRLRSAGSRCCCWHRSHRSRCCSPRSACTACSRIWSASARRRSACGWRSARAPADVVRLFVREGAGLTLVGVADGLAGRSRVTPRAVDAAVRRDDDRSDHVRRRGRHARRTSRCWPATFPRDGQPEWIR